MNESRLNRAQFRAERRRALREQDMLALRKLGRTIGAFGPPVAAAALLGVVLVALQRTVGMS